MDGPEDLPLLARVVAELPEIFRHEILPMLVGLAFAAARSRHDIGHRLNSAKRGFKVRWST
jgi:hypothetical protein